MTLPYTETPSPLLAPSGSGEGTTLETGRPSSTTLQDAGPTAGSASDASAGRTPAEAELTITFGCGYTHPLGPRCDGCHATEARCARDEGCCAGCTHFGPQLLRRMPVRCGTERGYQRHRYVQTSACLPCRAAHARHNRSQS